MNGNLTRRETGSAKKFTELKLSRNRAKSDIAVQKINQEFECQRFQLHQASRWADQAQRDKINWFGDLGLRNALQENCARDCKEIAELRKILSEETERGEQTSNN